MSNYILLHHLKNCSPGELKEQMKFHKEPLKEWEKKRLKYIRKLLKN